MGLRRRRDGKGRRIEIQGDRRDDVARILTKADSGRCLPVGDGDGWNRSRNSFGVMCRAPLREPDCRRISPRFNEKAFVQSVLEGYDDLALMPRAWKIAIRVVTVLAG